MKVITWTKAVVATAVEATVAPVLKVHTEHKAYKRAKTELKGQMIQEGLQLMAQDQQAKIAEALAAAEPEMEVNYTDADNVEHVITPEQSAREHRMMNAVTGGLGALIEAAKDVLPKKEEELSPDQKLVQTLHEANEKILAQKKLDEELKNIGEEQDARLDTLEARLLAMNLTVDDLAVIYDLTTPEGEEVS